MELVPETPDQQVRARLAIVLRGWSLWMTFAAAVPTVTLALLSLANFAQPGSSDAFTNAEQLAVSQVYEKRLRALRMELDHVKSKEAVARARLSRQANSLVRRSDWLRSVSSGFGSTDTVLSGLRLRSHEGYNEPGDVLLAVEDSLRRAERRQLGDIDRLGRKLRHRTQRLAKVLELHGISPSAEATGGPLIALKGNSDFDGKVAEFEAAQVAYDHVRSRADRLPQGSPVPGQDVSSRFGSRRDPLNGRQAMHGGLDFRAPRGHPVQATAAGTVTFAKRRGGYGKLVVIDHGDGMTTRYGHLSRITVSKGQRIERGALIGKVGSTGRSTGPHLHYEVRRRGQVRDPAHYVRLRRKLKSLM